MGDGDWLGRARGAVCAAGVERRGVASEMSVDQENDRCWGARVAVAVAVAVTVAALQTASTVGRTSDGDGLRWLKHGGSGGDVTRCGQRDERTSMMDQTSTDKERSDSECAK